MGPDSPASDPSFCNRNLGI